MARKPVDFEAQLKRLQEIVAELESGNASLERGVALYKEGVNLARDCRERLQNARNEIRVFSRGVFEIFDETCNEDSGSVNLGNADGTTPEQNM